MKRESRGKNNFQNVFLSRPIRHEGQQDFSRRVKSRVGPSAEQLGNLYGNSLCERISYPRRVHVREGRGFLKAAPPLRLLSWKTFNIVFLCFCFSTSTSPSSSETARPATFSTPSKRSPCRKDSSASRTHHPPMKTERRMPHSARCSFPKPEDPPAFRSSQTRKPPFVRDPEKMKIYPNIKSPPVCSSFPLAFRFVFYGVRKLVFING